MKIPDFVARWSTEEGDPYPASLVRAVVAALIGYAVIRRFSELSRDGYFGNLFHLPIWPEAIVPSATVYTALLGLQLVTAAAALVGVWPRQAIFATSLVGLFLLGCDRLQYHNNRYALLLMGFLLSFAPCDQRLTIWPRPVAKSRGPLWAQRLVQLQASMIYIASGGTKLLDHDWRTGLVLGDRIVRYTDVAIASGAPAALVAFLARPSIAEVLAKIAIATELSLAVALWNRRARPYAMWWGVWFHLTIQVTTTVDSFTWLTLANYALFAVPETRERVIRFSPRRRGARALVASLDWLRRWRAEPVDEAFGASASVRLVDRDGRVTTGFEACVLAFRTLPLLFPLWLPLALALRVTSAIRPASARATGAAG